LYNDITDHRKISINALEEVIHKQTKEIQSLKADLVNEKETGLVRINEIEAKYTSKLRDLSKQLSDFEAAKAESDLLSEKRVESLKKEYEGLLEDQKKKVANLNEEKASLSNSVDHLKKQIEEFKEEKNQSSIKSEAQFRKLAEENLKYLNELQNLRQYVNDSLPTMQTIKEMTLEREKYEEQILKIKHRNDLVIKENNALQIRLKSINEILSIQEAQLESTSSKSNNSNASPSSPSG
jgi:hypothetical protein